MIAKLPLFTLWTTTTRLDLVLLLFPVAVYLGSIYVHSPKKVGIGVPLAETVPYPFWKPEIPDQAIAISAILKNPLSINTGFLIGLAAVLQAIQTPDGYFI